MSAGGPILDPSLDCIVTTPICSHSLFSRSVIFNADREIYLLVNGDEQTADVILDGEIHISVDSKTPVKVVKNRDISVRFIKFKKDAFYNILSRKIK